MRINEAYEHETILPHAVEESCPLNGCNKIGTQCVNVASPLTLTPTATVGTPSVTCQGSPSVVCVTNADGTACTVTMTQRVCMSVAIRYGVSLSAGEPTIGCATSTGDCAGC